MIRSIEPEASAPVFDYEVRRDVVRQHEEFWFTVSYEALRRLDRDAFRRFTGQRLREIHEQMLLAWDKAHAPPVEVP